MRLSARDLGATPRAPAAPTKKAERHARTHGEILAATRRLLRERGIEGTSVADVMGAAGLTVGGFYAHFPSKGALVETALRQITASFREPLQAELREARSPRKALREGVRRYLSPVHRDAPGEGCPAPALAAEVARADRPLRRVFAEEMEKLVTVLAEPLGGTERARRRARGAFAAMVGGLLLSRMTQGTASSDALLSAAQDAAMGALLEGERSPRAPRRRRAPR